MGLRGPLRTPGSVRSLREAAKRGDGGESAPAERPDPPKGLRPKVRARFEAFVDAALAAGVPVRAGDAYMFQMAAQTSVDFDDAKDADKRVRIGQNLERYLAKLGLDPTSRVRLGVNKPAPKTSKTAALLSLVASTPEKSE